MAKSKQFIDDGILKITSAYEIKKSIWDLYKKTGIPMTHIVKKAIAEYLEKNEKEA